MVFKIIVTLLLVHAVKGEEDNDSLDVLAELPLQELLLQKKNLEKDIKPQETSPVALPLNMGRPFFGERSEKERRKKPIRKTFHEEESEDDKGWMHEKKEKYKIHDILNTSLTALSYLAFGGYLVCMIVNTLREKKRRFMMTYPTGTGTGNNQFVTRRPIKVRFPAVAVHSGKKRRKRAYEQVFFEYPDMGIWPPQEADDFAILNLMD
ncbi:hypothetical protein RUM43_011360 [Polyplax serrata]|uniref:Uncharacterized protein n=1 Tax=Polyplax serrata TaxID=468196 RepID=A0AAN8NTM0_POLSC